MNIQQKRTKGAVTSHTELSWTMPEMRTRNGKHSTWLGNSLFISFPRNTFVPGRGQSTPFLAVTLDYFGDTSLSWLGDHLGSEPLFSPQLNSTHHRNNLLLPVTYFLKSHLYHSRELSLLVSLPKRGQKSRTMDWRILFHLQKLHIWIVLQLLPKTVFFPQKDFFPKLESVSLKVS